MENQYYYNEIAFNEGYEKIIKIIKYANQTRFYSSLFKENNINIESMTYDDFRKIPYLTKEVYRNNNFNIIKSSVLSGLNVSDFNKQYNMDDKDEMLSKYNLMLKITSGSTGKPLEVIKSKNDNSREYTALNYFRKKIYKVDLTRPFVWVWPVSTCFISEVSSYNKKISYDNNGYKYLISAFNDKEFRMLTELCINNCVKWITSSPSMLYNYSKYLIEHHINMGLNYIECHSEPLLPFQKKEIQKAFGIEPVNVYSSNEVQFMGITCPNNHMHILENNVFIEVEKNEYGYDEIIVTSLNCHDSIFLRYRIGDCAHIYQPDEIDNCIYNKSRIIELKNYRNNDLARSKNKGEKFEPHLITASIYALEEKFKVKILNYKIVQKSYYEFIYNIDLEDPENKYKHFLEQYMSNLFGYLINVNIELFNSTSSTYEGKFTYFSIDKDFKLS